MIYTGSCDCIEEDVAIEWSQEVEQEKLEELDPPRGDLPEAGVIKVRPRRGHWTQAIEMRRRPCTSGGGFG